jgi:hypothetical protein
MKMILEFSELLNQKTMIYIKERKMKILTFFLTCILCIMICFTFMSDVAEPQIGNGMIDVKDAIAIVSSALGVKIVVDGNIEGQIPLELDDQSPRQIKEALEQKLNESGFLWITEGGIVHITKNPKGIQSIYGRQLPLSYYIGVISRNNLFRPLGNIPVEIKSDLVLTGIFGVGNTSKAIIEDKTTNKSYYISRGESIGNSKVIEIKEDQVILEGSNGRTVLKIQQKKD